MNQKKSAKMIYFVNFSKLWASARKAALLYGLLIISLVATTLLTGCARVFNDPIVGQWEDTETSDRFEFLSDHTFTITSHGVGVSGKWSKIDNGRIKLDVVRQGTPTFIMMEDVNISGDKMKGTILGRAGTARRLK